MFEVEDIVIYGCIIALGYLYLTKKFSMKNNSHKAIFVVLIVSWLFFKGIQGRRSGLVILPPLKDFFNKKQDNKE